MSWSFGINHIIAHLIAPVQLASRLYRDLLAVQPLDNLKSLQQEIADLMASLTALEQHVSTDSEAPLIDISLLERTRSDCGTIMEQMMEILKRQRDTTLVALVHVRDKQSGVARDMEKVRRALVRHESMLNSWLFEQGCTFVPDEKSEAILIAVGRRFNCPFMRTADTWDNRPTNLKLRVLKAPIPTPISLVRYKSRDMALSEDSIEIIPNADLSLAPISSSSYGWTFHVSTDLDRELLDGTPSLPHACQKSLRIHYRNKSRPLPDSGQKELSRGDHEMCHRYLVSYRSTLESLFHCIKAALQLNTSKPLMLLSPLFFAPSTVALGLDYEIVRDGDSWIGALRSTHMGLVSVSSLPSSHSTSKNHNNSDIQAQLWTHPITQSPLAEQSPSPTTLLLATFLSTSTIALAAQAGKNDAFQTYIIAFFALIGAITATVLGAGLRDFVFGYLFWGCVVGVGGSWIVHRVLLSGKGREEKELKPGNAD